MTPRPARIVSRPLRRATWLLPLLVAACTRSAPTPSGAAAPPPARERSAYATACASCHGADGRGGGPAAKAFRTPPPDLTLLAARNGGVFPRDAVVAIIVGERQIAAHGAREMPVWSIRFEPSSGATAVASIVAQHRIDAIVSEVEAFQRATSD